MAVARYSTSADAYIIAKSFYGNATGRWALGRDNSAGGGMNFLLDAGSGVNTVYADTTSTSQLIVGTWNRSTTAIYKNGSTALTSSLVNTTNYSTLFPLLVGAYNNTSGGVPPQAGLFLNGDLAEILVFQSNVSQYQRQRFEGYLAWKWGLQASLPFTHPFRYDTPQGIDTRFLPNQIDGLELWLDAADYSTFTVGAPSSLTGWADKSPFQKVTAVSPNRPIIKANGLNGYSSIQFTAASNNVISTVFSQAPGTGDYAIFTVWRPTVSTATIAIAGLGANTGTTGTAAIGWHTSQASYLFFEYATGEVDYKPPSYDGWKIQVGTRYTSSVQMWVNGNYQNSTMNGPSTVSTNITAAGIFIGSGSAYFASAELAEALVYRGTVTPFDKQRLEGYLAWKWGLQSNLPNAHPFRLRAPTPSTVFSPTLYSSVRAWYDGADPAGTGTAPANGATVATWVDKSPASNNATAVGAATYVADYPRGYLNFSAASNTYYTLSNGNFFANQYYTAFIVERVQSTVATQFATQTIFSGSNTAPSTNFLVRYMGSSLSTFSIDYYNNGIGGVSTPQYTERYMQPTRVWTISQRTSNWSIFLNGSTIRTNTNNILPTSWLGAAIGRDQTTSGGNFTGHMKELMFYVGEMDPNDRQTFEGYLAWKWGQQQFLPQAGRFAHPYRSLDVTRSTITVFDPRAVGDLRTWLDASDPANFVLTGTSSIVRWLDKSDYKNDYSTINASSLTRITDAGRPAVFLTGSNGLYSVNPFYANIGGTIAFVVAKSDSGGGTIWGQTGDYTIRYGGFLLSGGPGNAVGNAQDWAGNSYCVNGSSTIVATSTTYTNYHLVDGYDTQQSFGLTTPWQIGQWRDTTRNFGGKICELLIYQSTMTLADRQRVQGYLGWKWGLQSRFPPDHPYRYVDIYESTLTQNAIPAQPPGLTLWLDAADTSTITQTTSSISEWRDKSGFSYNLTQPSTSTRPEMVGSNYIRFNLGRNFDIPQTAVNNAANYTMLFQFIPISTTNYIIAKQHDGINTYNLLSMTSTNAVAGPTVGAMYWRTTNTSGLISTSAAVVPLGSSILMSLDFDGTTANFYRFGSSFGSFTSANFAISSATTATNFKMGGWFSGTPGSLPPSSIGHFQMGEFLFYNSTLGPFQRQRMEGYLAWKWGVQAQLPPTHPFFSRAPA
jgi:hypothetical protein